jgi:hypothetical protein
MYGLIHRSIRDFVLTQGGESTWRHVQESTGASHSWFATMESYDDEITLTIVEASARALGIEVDVFLRGLGRYWSTRTAPDNYGGLMSLGGPTLRSFIRNLDAMHDQVALSFLNLEQPSFSVVSEDPERMVVLYESRREGLEEFVIGLFEGLGTYFGEEIDVRLTRPRELGGVEYTIHWTADLAS